MPAPTLVSYSQTASFETGGATKTLPSAISWLTGDLIVYLAGAEGGGVDALGAPTATGLTFTSQRSVSNVGSGAFCATQLATAIAASGGSSNITGSNTHTTELWGFGVWVWRSHGGIGNSAEQHTTTKTVSLTPTAVDGGMCWGAFDWGATAGNTATPTPTNTRISGRDTAGTHYAFLLADLVDQTSAGAVSYGLTTSSTAPISIVVLEIKASVPVYSYPVRDDFAGSGALSANWTAMFGTTAPTRVSGVWAPQTFANVNGSYWSGVTFPNDQYSQVTAVTVGDGGPMVRCSGTNNSYLLDVQAGGWALYKFVAGAATLLTNASVAVANGSVLRLEARGTTLTGYINGTSVVTFTDSTFASGAPGIYNFSTGAAYDDFEGGPVVVQVLPDGDVSAGSWTSTAGTLAAAINEAAANDTSFIQSGLTPVNDVSEVTLQDVTELGGSTFIVVRARSV